MSSAYFELVMSPSLLLPSSARTCIATCMRAQDVKAQLKKPRRQKLPWMKDDEDTAAASGDLLTAATPAPVAAAAMVAAAVATASAATETAAVAMVATETEPAEAAEVVQAHALPLL